MSATQAEGPNQRTVGGLPGEPGLLSQKAVAESTTTLPVDHAGTTLFVRGWHSAEKTLPPVLIIHDLGEDSEQHVESAKAFFELGHSAYCFDLRGHGNSGRRLGHAPSFDALIRDLLQVAAWVKHSEDGKIPVILGQGVGALILLEFTKRYGSYCQSAVLCAPCFELTSRVPALTRFTIRVLADIWPTLRIPAQICPSFASGFRHGDKLASGRHAPRLTARFANELLKAMTHPETRFSSYQGPMLVLIPERDGICAYQNLRRAAALHADHNLTVQELPGAPHHVLTAEPLLRSKAVALISQWTSQFLGLKTSSRETTLQESAADGRFMGASKSPAVLPDKPGATKA